MDNNDKHGGDRRRFMIRAAGALGALALGGCDQLSQTKKFTEILDSAEALNKRIQPALTANQAMAREYTKADLSPHFKSNGTHHPRNAEYNALLVNDFRDWRLEVDGLVENPMRLSLTDIQKLPARTQITRHDCVEGWSCIGEWSGARLSALLDRVKPKDNARYVMFYSYDALDGVHKYYESIDMQEARHIQTILAYRFNGKPLPVPYGAPLRLRLPRQLGYKMAKYLRRIELVSNFDHIKGGHGGYWEDRGYAWYAGI
jgi:DMSO/TMAO reductase YedYZ molybdopterin-dependent catalytic subunit